MEVTFRHGLTYGTKDQTSLQRIADSLVANERLLLEAAGVLGTIVDGLEIKKVNISLRQITQESPLKEIYWGALVFTFQEDLVREVPPLLEQLLRTDIPDQYNTLVTVTALLLAFYGVDFVYRRLNPGSSSRHISRMLDGLIHDVSEMVDKPENEIRDKLAERYGEGKLRQLAKASTRFFSPAKEKKGIGIKPNVGPEISPEVVDDIPSQQDIDDFSPAEVPEPIEGVEIEIHQQDVDYTKSGWAGIVKDVYDKRLKMQLYPPLKPDDLYTKKNIVGDIILVSRRNEGGDYIPYMFHLVRIDRAD